MNLRAAGTACLAAALLATTGSASADPHRAGPRDARAPEFVAGRTGFHSVLAYGAGQSASAADLAAYEATGTPPDSFTSEVGLYNRVITQQPDGDLEKYFKDSDFAQISGDTETIGDATVVRDTQFHVPHIYGSTRAGAMYAAGYVTAENRLFLMDVLRRTSEGSLAELLGSEQVPADSAALGQFDLSPQQLTDEFLRLPEDEGAAGQRALDDFRQYVDGINAFIDATQTNPTLLPAEYPALGVTPRHWTLADSAAEAYLLIAQFTVFGDAEYLQSEIFARLADKLGEARARKVYADLRNLENPHAPVTATRGFPSDRPASGRSSAVPLDLGSLEPRNAVVSSSPGLAASGAAMPAFARDLAKNGLNLEHHASNALLVSAAHSRSGHALAAMGPQVGYYSPEILVEYEIHAPGIHASGMSFPGASPYPLIGHTADFAWSGTTANGDNADTFAERLCKDGDHYRYRGKCRAFTHRDQVLQLPVSPTSPEPPQTVTLRTMNSVHGPVHSFATSHGKKYALVRSTAVNQHGIRSLVAFMRMAEGSVHGPRQFIANMRHYTGNENWFYVSQNHIAWLQSGWFQRHAPGTDLEQPINGDGRWDWSGFDPRTQLFDRHGPGFNPRAIDPEQGYLASWNNKGARHWRAAPGIWSYGRIHRDLLLRDPTARAIRHGRKLTLDDVVGIAGNASTQDLRGVEVLPDLLRAVGGHNAKVRVLKAWVRSGAHRRDTTGDNVYEHSAAVALFDAWWRRLVHDLFDPQLGNRVVKELQGGIDLVLDGRAVQTGFYDGWYNQVSDVVRGALGTQPQPRALRCGSGSAKSCRSLLRHSLRAAFREVARQQDTSEMSKWEVKATCDKGSGCDQNEPVTAGAIDTPNQPWENRGTFHQAVELSSR